jgi:hypothetical protein
MHPKQRYETSIFEGHQKMANVKVGDEIYNSSEMAAKVQNDIGFLVSRIELMKKQSNPNPLVLQTYEGMLESRRSVQDWLKTQARKSEKAS